MPQIDRQDLRRRAEAVLRRNDRGAWTACSSSVAHVQIAVSSAMASVGWATVDRTRAVSELEGLLWTAWADGRVPHQQFRGASPEDPLRKQWQSQETSSIAAPPIMALAAERVHRHGGNEDQLRALLDRIDKAHRWYYALRDPNGWDCIAIAHPEESLLPASPGFDRGFGSVSSAEIAAAIAEDQFGPGRFAIYDPTTTALLGQAELALARTSAALGQVHPDAQARARALQKGLRYKLYDVVHGRYRYTTARGLVGIHGPDVCPDTLGAYLPATLPDVPGRDTMLSALRTRCWSVWPLTTVSATDSHYDPSRGTRGGVDITANWLLADALGPELVKRSLELMDFAGFWEFYDPRSGQGYGRPDFTASAAACLDWLASMEH